MKKVCLSVILLLAIFAMSAGAGGGKIIFTSGRSGRHQIYAMNEDGSGVRRLTNNSADDGRPIRVRSF